MQDLSCVLPIYLLIPIQIHWAQCPCSHCTCLLCSPVEVTDTQGGKKLILCRHILLACYATDGYRATTKYDLTTFPTLLPIWYHPPLF